MFALFLTATCALASSDTPTLQESIYTVSSKANLYATDLEVAPDPGGGGGGRFPIEVTLPAVGPDRVVVFPEIEGAIAAGVNPPFPLHGADGSTLLTTNVTSFQGISGMVHSTRSMFLAGVFLEDDRQLFGAPPSLNVTNLGLAKEVVPVVGQTFFIGDGRLDPGAFDSGELQAFHVPPTATRLMLGFVDANAFWGAPGWYDDNRGRLRVRTRVMSSDSGLFVIDFKPGQYGQGFGRANLVGVDPTGSRIALIHGSQGEYCYPWPAPCLDLDFPNFVSSLRPNLGLRGITDEIFVSHHLLQQQGRFQLLQWDYEANELRVSNSLPGAW